MSTKRTALGRAEKNLLARARAVNAVARKSQNIRGRSLAAAFAAPMSGRLNRRGVASKETGFVDLANAVYVFDTTGSITLIATVAQGASVNQRVGKKILWKSMQLRGLLNNGGITNMKAALLIVYDKRPTGALPLITDILNTANAMSFNNDANSGRFSIIKRMDVTQVPNTIGDSQNINIDDFINLKKLNCTFKAAGSGVIGDIEEGALYMITVGTSAPGAGSAATLGIRTRFWDV